MINNNKFSNNFSYYNSILLYYNRSTIVQCCQLKRGFLRLEKNGANSGFTEPQNGASSGFTDNGASSGFTSSHGANSGFKE